MKKTWDRRAEAVFAQGCNTYSKRSDQFVKGVFPTHIDDLKTLEETEKCYIWADDKPYIDWIGGLGSTILSSNTNFCLPTHSEVILAEMIQKRIPFIQKMRFLKTGSEATQAAVRIARAYKGQSKGIGCSYNGWHNWRIAAELPGAGCVNERFEKVNSIDEIIEEIISGYAYCILEPYELKMNNGFIPKLIKLRELCTRYDTVLIFDEIVCGMRTPKYCMAQYLGIEPDIICLGKAIADGHALAIVGGKDRYMNTPDYFVSSTFASEVSSIYAAINTLKILTPSVLNALWKKGENFLAKFNAITPKLQLIGLPTKAVFQGDEMIKHLFMQEMLYKGHMTGKAFHLFVHHNKDMINKFITDSKECIQRIEAGKVKLKGSLSTPVFRRY